MIRTTIVSLTLAIFFVASLGFNQVSFADTHLYGHHHETHSTTGKMMVGLGVLAIGALTFGSTVSKQQKPVDHGSDIKGEFSNPKAEAVYKECLAEREAELRWSAPTHKVRDCTHLARK
ncbi:TPA: hypothetical protein DEP58_00090 [Patescibacteria group bacterium]|nr:MAG: hypothetical protein UU98_C0002G0035 [Parcubacteria group bacterium GW2011_GWD2_42_14]HCC04690.1 hypothetical protein [Patescibacteria group bacterium]